ncbi:ketopantoate reductase family protein [Aquibium microcysteis]|uniref:ketopantoate reductase family protein n=1 Tax=Aquibium microcysteis TaxID=675281 RepID=UPI001EF2C322|nr:ketopantoate reductase family protein [Aquibium microcysteis]
MTSGRDVMRICILGAGSLGCVFGGLLAAAGHDVLLVNRSADLVERLNSGGLTLAFDSGDRVIPVQAATDCRGRVAFDLIVVLVKSFHTREALAAAREAIGPETVVMSLQNGLGHEDVIAEIAGPSSVVIGKTYVGGVMVSPGKVVAGVVGKPTYIGEPDGTASERVRRIARAFSAAGLETLASDRIMGVVWDKLLVNVATGALSGITGLAYGDLYDVPEVAECACAAVREAMEVAAAAGIALSCDDPYRPWRIAGEGLPPGFKASMLQSLEKGSTTEIDFVNGAVVRWGDRYGVPTPVNRTLVAAIKGVERSLAPTHGRSRRRDESPTAGSAIIR